MVVSTSTDLEKIFLLSISDLVKALSKEEVADLEKLLKEKKSEMEIFNDIVQHFPDFKTIFLKKISENKNG